MKLFEMKQKFGGFPKKAGAAVLKWKEDGRPTRDGKTITLPAYGGGTEFFPLRNGAQFLLQTPDRDQGRVFFGGTDEQPFLVEMKPSVIVSLRGGERRFFNSIKPDGAKMLEEVFNTKAVRQGDWFAVPLPLSWGATRRTVSRIIRISRMPWLTKEGPDSWIFESSNRGNNVVQLGGTRHNLIAKHYICSAIRDEKLLGCVLIGEGILKAPDHGDRVLNGPHVFFQTAYLVNPRTAD